MNNNLFAEITNTHKRAFLCAYAKLGYIPKACEAAGVGRMTVWEWRKADKEFLTAFSVAKELYHEEYLSILEEELKKRSLDPASPMSTVALFFALKAEHPEKYREKYPEQRLTGEITIKLSLPDRVYSFREPDVPLLEAPKSECLLEGGNDNVSGQGVTEEDDKGTSEALQGVT